MTRTATPSFRAFFAVCGLLLLSVSASAQVLPFNPTHYWTYQALQPTGFPQPILVQDQFFRQPIPVTIDTRLRLLNWVHKNNSAVPDTNLHYTWWNIHEKLPVNRQAVVTNQFGSAIVQVLNLEFMLAPAWKNQPNPVAPLANHYLCYRAVGFPPPPAGYDLKDEWRSDFQLPQDMQYLCTPCWKQHLGQVFPAVDTVTHFAVYPIAPVSDRFIPLVSDQFLTQPMLVAQSPLEYLFVPSEKTELPTDVKHRTWGRVKQLYR
jgi:hypothetical protein